MTSRDAGHWTDIDRDRDAGADLSGPDLGIEGGRQRAYHGLLHLSVMSRILVPSPSPRRRASVMSHQSASGLSVRAVTTPELE